MSNPMQGMKMTNPIKNLVSKKRRRYREDGYDLDLTYIQQNVIAMGFPAEKLEGVYRNHIDDVVKLLDSKHKDHYKIYNLCSERSYDVQKFHSRVAHYPFNDHNPPNIELIKPFCADVDAWLTEHKENVAVVHCKAGKGRTGVMICCYMIHSRLFSTAEEALNYYGQMRTHDKKGVTIPSQRRYVMYYERLVKRNVEYSQSPLTIKEIRLQPVPPILSGGQALQCVISTADTKIYCSPPQEVKRGATQMTILVEGNVVVTGDFRIEFFIKPKMKRKEKLFHLWANTFFIEQEGVETDVFTDMQGMCLGESTSGGAARVLTYEEHMRIVEMHRSRAGSAARSPSENSTSESEEYVLKLSKWELDNAHKDKANKIYPADFEVSLHFKEVEDCCGPLEVIALPHLENPSESSEAESSEHSTAEEEDDEEEDWGDGESTHL